MKRFAVLVFVTLSAVLLGSCYLMTARSTGTIQLDFAGRATKAMSGETPDRARIYLYSSISPTVYSLYRFGSGLYYYETGYPGSATLGNIPAGHWQVLVSVGNDQANGSFSTQSFGSSGIILVSAGSNTSATITTTPSPFLDWVDAFGKNINGLTAQGGFGFLAATDQSNLYYWSTVDCDPLVSGTPAADYLTVIPAPAGYQYNSVGLDPSGSFLLVNTNKGVETSDGKVVYSNFSQNLIVDGSPVNVLQSGGMSVSAPNGGLALLYSSERGLGGFRRSSFLVSDLPASTDWVNIVLSGATSAPPLYQTTMNVTGGYGFMFLATRLGAFWTTSDLVDSQVIGCGDFATLARRFDGPNGETIQAIAVDSLGSTLYIGTRRGAYSSLITETPRTPAVSFGPWTSIAVTAGDSIADIRLSPDDEYVAFRSTYNLYVMDAQTGNTKSYPFYAGLPGKLSSMTWDTSVPALFLGGSSGIVVLTSPYLPLGPQ